MAKQRDNRRVRIYRWPMAGVREGHAHSQPPPAQQRTATGGTRPDFTINPGTVYSVNCRTFDPLTDRSRGAQRPGLTRLSSSPAGVGIIQDINQVLGLGGLTVLPVLPGSLTGGGSIPEQPTFTDAMAAINSQDTDSGSPYSEAYANALWTPTMASRDADPIVLDGGAPTSFTVEGQLDIQANGANHDLTAGDTRQLLRVTMPASVTNGPVASAVFTGQVDWFYEVLSVSGLKAKPVIRVVFSTNGTAWTTIGEFRTTGATVSGTQRLNFEGWAGPDWPTQTVENLSFSLPIPFVPSLASSFDIGLMLELAWDAAAVALLPNDGPGVGEDRTVNFIATIHDFEIRLFSA